MVKVCSVIFNQVFYDLCLYKAQISGERLQDHWSSGFIYFVFKEINLSKYLIL